LWAILLRNSSDAFVVQSTAVDFLETIERLIVSNATSPVVRNRLLHVLGDVVYKHPTGELSHSRGENPSSRSYKTTGFVGYGLQSSPWMPQIRYIEEGSLNLAL
jgi:hypothetical protein